MMELKLPIVRLPRLLSMDLDVNSRSHFRLEDGRVGFLDAAQLSDEIRLVLEYAVQFGVPLPIFDSADGCDDRDLGGRIAVNSAPFDRMSGTVDFVQFDHESNNFFVSILPSPRIFILPLNSRTFQDDLELLKLAAKNHDEVWIFVPEGTWEIHAVRRC